MKFPNMKNERSDASTSTEDTKARPLRLYYFAHPFGVLSPEPPRVVTLVPDDPTAPSASLVTVPTAHYTFKMADLPRTSRPSAWWPEAMWWCGAGRVSLPPLRTRRPAEPPAPPRPTRTPPYPRRWLPPLAAPPLSCPRAPPSRSRLLRDHSRRLQTSTRRGRGAAEGGAARSLLRVRTAWPRRAAHSRRLRSRQSSWDSEAESEEEGQSSAMLRPAASPGLLRRRYSAPETIMRKYRLAQLNSEETNSPIASCTCAPGEGARRERAGARRGREAVRRSALLRRLYGRATCCCGHVTATRSLDASQSELRPISLKRLPISHLSLPSSTDLLLSKSPRFKDTVASSYTDTDGLTGSISKSDYREVSDATDDEVQFSGLSDAGSSVTVGTDKTTCCHAEKSFENSVDMCSTSTCTAKETFRAGPDLGVTRTGSADGGVSEITVSGDNDDGNFLQFNRALMAESPYDILEIAVSETSNTTQTPTSKVDFCERISSDTGKKYKAVKDCRRGNIDEYVSNILVESLNSLTDQLESMNAAIGTNRKLNIIEKEIKVKLQNTGVNTIVHLSPTSNNQIIFGHEELCGDDERRDLCRSALSPAIRDDSPTSADSPPEYSPPGHLRAPPPPDSCVQADNVNRAVLQQIQKLFRDDLQNVEPDPQYSDKSMRSISHIELSDVDAYIDNNGGCCSTTDENETKMVSHTADVIGGVGAGNYYEQLPDNALVPRFSALPHTDSMEVNTSSSEDDDVLGSECTSLVDSLDDPNSPRSIMLKKSANGIKRSELVRSSIDVLDLLPENIYQTESAASREKGESFFVRINDCENDCEKKDIVVADHMPETIKQRLYKRHRKRELRMECARRSKVKQLRKEMEKQRLSELRKSKKEIERECIALINAIIDDVISKISHDELKCMRIKQKSVMMVSSKSDEYLSTKNRKKDVEVNNNNNPKLCRNNRSESCSDDVNKKYHKEKFQIRGKLSLQAYPPSTPNDNQPKRIYQKSEIHDGKKCIEILEILEYVNSSASSPETSHSDDNHSTKNKKSRIPVPVPEKIGSQKTYNYETSGPRSPNPAHVVTDSQPRSPPPTRPARRRASLPRCEPRSRSNSLRFKHVFDIIPEERSSVSIESANEDQTTDRRASAPTLPDRLFADKQVQFGIGPASIASSGSSDDLKFNPDLLVTEKKETKSAGTSPMPNRDVHRSVLTQTSALVTSSPLYRSAATSPIRNSTTWTQTPLLRKKSVSNQQQKATNRQPAAAHSAARPHAPHQGGNGQRERLDRQCEDSRTARCSSGTGVGMEGSSTAAGGASSSSSSESSGLLCALAPGWLHARRRRRRAPSDAGQWAVTVAGSCPAALPADVEMRLRFPEPHPAGPRAPRSSPAHPARSPALRRAVEQPQGQAEKEPRGQAGRLTLTLKKEASDSSILASKSVKKSAEPLPDVETFRASRSKTRSSVKMRRGCSLHCWLPDDAPAHTRSSNGLTVQGSAIVPGRRPRRY